MTDNPNMKLWNQVEASNPNQLKAVEFGRKFTSIDAHSQIKRATEVFGQIGIGWRFDSEIVDAPENLCIVKVYVFVKTEDGWSEPVMQYGSGEWKSSKGRVDADAPKKATTDGLTKCLSYLGFNADIFLGQWNGKDIEKAKREESSLEDTKSVTAYVDVLLNCTTMDELKGKYMEVPTHLKTSGSESAKVLNDAKDKMKTELSKS